jgi:hypothetical protein
VSEELASRREVDEALEAFGGWLYRLIGTYRDRWGYVPRGTDDFGGRGQ